MNGAEAREKITKPSIYPQPLTEAPTLGIPNKEGLDCPCPECTSSPAQAEKSSLSQNS